MHPKKPEMSCTSKKMHVFTWDNQQRTNSVLKRTSPVLLVKSINNSEIMEPAKSKVQCTTSHYKDLWAVQIIRPVSWQYSLVVKTNDGRSHTPQAHGCSVTWHHFLVHFQTRSWIQPLVFILFVWSHVQNICLETILVQINFLKSYTWHMNWPWIIC